MQPAHCHTPLRGFMMSVDPFKMRGRVSYPDTNTLSKWRSKCALCLPAEFTKKHWKVRAELVGSVRSSLVVKPAMTSRSPHCLGRRKHLWRSGQCDSSPWVKKWSSCPWMEKRSWKYCQLGWNKYWFSTYDPDALESTRIAKYRKHWFRKGHLKHQRTQNNHLRKWRNVPAVCS